MRTSISLRDRFSILKRDGFRCQYCGAYAGDAELCIDHVIPKARGGEDDDWNLLTACYDCNQGKNSTNEELYLLWAMERARRREDHDTGFHFWIILSARGWEPDKIMDAINSIGGPAP